MWVWFKNIIFNNKIFIDYFIIFLLQLYRERKTHMSYNIVKDIKMDSIFYRICRFCQYKFNM